MDALEELLREMNNWFAVRRASGLFVFSGCEPGVSLAEGQYYLVEGSVFNDGLHRHPEALVAEAFDGSVTALAVPRAVVELSERIAAWRERHEAEADSPYASESAEGYSYTMKQGACGSYGWRDRFAPEMRRWRKL